MHAAQHNSDGVKESRLVCGWRRGGGGSTSQRAEADRSGLGGLMRVKGQDSDSGLDFCACETVAGPKGRPRSQPGSDLTHTRALAWPGARRAAGEAGVPWRHGVCMTTEHTESRDGGVGRRIPIIAQMHKHNGDGKQSEMESHRKDSHSPRKGPGEEAEGKAVRRRRTRG